MSNFWIRTLTGIAFLVVMVLAAFITPADPLSMFVLAVPLYLLYEFSILQSREPVAEEEEEAGK